MAAAAKDDDFRLEVRNWLEANCPRSMRNGNPGNYTGGGRRAQYPNPELKRWLDSLAERGWTAPMWPRVYGGGGLSLAQTQVLSEEMRRIGTGSPLGGMGLTMIGPALLEYGTEEQKLEHLPPIIRGDIWWCQGYSEPGAGSDLASLRTRAEEDGDFYIINGSKIWTSGADQADWIFALVRTDSTVPKHEGISFIVFDMTTPGVSVRPIRLISGASPFCQTFFDNVRVPKRNLVGVVNKGWTVGKRLLQYERTSLGSTGMGGVGVDLARIALGKPPAPGLRIADDGLRQDITVHRMNDRAFQLSVRRSGEERKSGLAPADFSSFLKYFGTEQNKRRFEITMRINGHEALGWEGGEFNAEALAATRGWLRSKANSIEGGSSEVQLNIIAKRILGLPD